MREVEDPTQFGVVVLEGERIKAMVEKPAEPPSNLAIVGIYVFQEPKLLYESLDRIVEANVRTAGEIQLTDAMAKTIRTVPFHGHRFEGRRFDCGDKVGFCEANVAFALARPDLKDQIVQVLRSYV